LLPIVLAVDERMVDGWMGMEIKKGGDKDGWMTDPTSRTPTQQTPNENPTNNSTNTNASILATD